MVTINITAEQCRLRQERDKARFEFNEAVKELKYEMDSKVFALRNKREARLRQLAEEEGRITNLYREQVAKTKAADAAVEGGEQ